MDDTTTCVAMVASNKSHSTVLDRNTLLPLSDHNAWYFPAYGYDSDSESLNPGIPLGNWGKKHLKDARWIRRGKMSAWGPGSEEWEAEERARKRIRLLLPQVKRSPSPPALPHLLRSSSPPVTSPYPQPVSQHLSYASFVMDKAVTHTFRSTLLEELEHSTNSLIEGESNMKKALGRLWQVISEDAEPRPPDRSVVPKREEDETDEMDDRAKRIARAPDLTPAIHRLFMFSSSSDVPIEPSHFTSPEIQQDNLERAVGVLRDIQDDGREYVERLHEIREGLGEVRAQRNKIWDMVRERAVKELQDAAIAAAP
ncbi:hypothetical protein CPB85DRAFT_1266700 [Mucidula mucida]|nr:hypothetical protein CPB85DRAFT_1266700 [Mucidula mucida]